MEPTLDVVPPQMWVLLHARSDVVHSDPSSVVVDCAFAHFANRRVSYNNYSHYFNYNNNDHKLQGKSYEHQGKRKFV